MKDNSRFVIAVHALTLLAERDRPTSSRVIGESAGVNAVTVRKVVGQLRSAGLVATSTGVNGGIWLAREPVAISLRDVFLTMRDDSLFGAYPDQPSEDCLVGRNLQVSLITLLDEAAQSMLTTLGTLTIADVLDVAVELDRVG